MVSPVIVITHAAFDPARRQSLNRLTSALRTEAPGIPVLIANDTERRGSLWCWRQAMEMGLFTTDTTHVVWLPDDALVCQDFGVILRACIAARPNDVFDCFVNHRGLTAHPVPTPWYATTDGYVGMGGVMPRRLLEEHLAWRDEHPELGDYPNDAGVNMWAALTGRLIYKTAWTLVRHDEALPSLEGHDEQAADGHVRDGLHPVHRARRGITEDVMNFLGRSYLAPEEHAPGHASAATFVGPTYKGNAFDIVRRLPPPWTAEMLDRMYRAIAPVPEDKPRVVIVVPVYRESEEIIRATEPSRLATQEDLETNGIECLIYEAPGESHVDRMRQRATHAALKLGATHVLWWDADISADDPATARRMVLSGHDIVGGACPFRDASKKVVLNLWPETYAALEEAQAGGTPFTTLPGGFIAARHVGSGFMTMTRKAILEMFAAHPERCHLSRNDGDRAEPLWAIWDAEMGPGDTPDQRMFETEDWALCRRWQALGHDVYVHLPSTFRHWGLWGFRGSAEQCLGLSR